MMEHPECTPERSRTADWYDGPPWRPLQHCCGEKDRGCVCGRHPHDKGFHVCICRRTWNGSEAPS